MQTQTQTVMMTTNPISGRIEIEMDNCVKNLELRSSSPNYSIGYSNESGHQHPALLTQASSANSNGSRVTSPFGATRALRGWKIIITSKSGDLFSTVKESKGYSNQGVETTNIGGFASTIPFF